MKPIFFNTMMVKEILKGNKTNTRRVVKFPKELSADLLPHGNFSVQYLGEEIVVPGFTPEYSHFVADDFYVDIKSPYVKDDILYVRETWSTRPSNECYIQPCHGGICQHESCDSADSPCFPDEYIYKADYDSDNYPYDVKWKPSIHMPKEAARLFLRVKDVKVERLQDITVEDIIKEGIHVQCNSGRCNGKSDISSDVSLKVQEMMKQGFSALWDSTVIKEIYKWSANPWVWAYDFEKLYDWEIQYIKE